MYRQFAFMFLAVACVLAYTAEVVSQNECPECYVCDQVTFMAIGDTRSGHDDHRALVEIMAQQDAEFYLHSGDFVVHEDSEREWELWAEISAPLLEQMPVVPAVGNHDGSTGDDHGFVERFGLTNTYHSVVHGDVLIITLDGYTEVESGYWFNDAQMAWLSEELARASQFRWVIIQVHNGPYGASEGRSGSRQIRDLLDEFEAAGVDLILSGHDHLYEHGLTENGIHYVVSAGGGAGLYRPRSSSTQGNTVLESSMVHHFLRFDASCEGLRVQAIDIEGNVIDEFVIP